MPHLDARLRALAAAAALQRVSWDGRTVDVPLARPFRIDRDEAVLQLADGGWLILAEVGSLTSLRAALRRWLRELPEGTITVFVLAERPVLAEILEEPPDRPAVRMRVALLDREETLWDQPWPVLADVLLEAAQRREAPPDDVLDRLRNREGVGWPERSAPPPTPTFERLVFALAQAHDLVRLLRGEARLRLRSGSHVTVLAWSGEPEVDDPALAAALARIAAGLAEEDLEPGLLVVDGPEDLLTRVQQVLGRGARLGRVNTISQSGVVKPADGELSQLLSLAHQWQGDLDLFPLLDAGLSRSRGRTIDRSAQAAGDTRLGLVRGLLQRVPGLRLSWLGRQGAELLREGGALWVRWVGPGGGRVEDVLARWRLAAVAARWTGHTVDLVLEGGDSATWERVRHALGGAPEGHVFHLQSDGAVHAKAGLFGVFRPAAWALRKLGRTPREDRQCSLEELQRELDRGAEADFRSAVMDAAFVERMSAVTPWATRGLLGAIIVAYAMQLRWDGADGLWQSGGALVVRMGALTGEGLVPILTSEPWRLLASSFLHAAWWHIGLNAWALWVLGRRLEAMIGPERLIVLYVASCLGGAMLHEAFSAPGDVAVGASTGILGLLAASGALALFRKDLLPGRIRKLLLREAWLNGLIIFGLSLLPFVGGLAHLGGALVGFGLVASGLLTLGVGPATSLDVGPTRVVVPAWLRPVAAGVGALAVGAAVMASVTGEPWNLGSEAGRVDEVSFFDGALVVPVPRESPRPAMEAGIEEDGRESLQVFAGDVLRDGLRVEVIAHPVPGVGSAWDVEDVVAVYGGDALDWMSTRIGDRPTAMVGVPQGDDRFVHLRWLIVENDVVVDVSMTALPDANTTRLGGSWTRLPAGVRVEGDWSERMPDDRVDRLRRARAGERFEDDPILDALVLAASDRQAARTRLDVVLQDQAARARAARIAQVVDGEAAVLLSSRALAQAWPEEQRSLRSITVQALLREGRWDAAISESAEDALTVGSAYYYAGKDDEARDAATRWQQEEIPWWFLGATAMTGDMPAGLLANLAWADLLQGDLERCRDRSEQAWRRLDELVFARFNESICALAAGDREAAGIRFDEALEQASLRGDRGLLRNVAVDLEALVERDVDGADELLARLNDVLDEAEGREEEPP